MDRFLVLWLFGKDGMNIVNLHNHCKKFTPQLNSRAGAKLTVTMITNQHKHKNDMKCECGRSEKQVWPTDDPVFSLLWLCYLLPFFFCFYVQCWLLCYCTLIFITRNCKNRDMINIRDWGRRITVTFCLSAAGNYSRRLLLQTTGNSVRVPYCSLFSLRVLLLL